MMSATPRRRPTSAGRRAQYRQNSTGSRKSAENLEELVRLCDQLTALLNSIRRNPENRMTGLVKWAIPKVAEERNRAWDALKLTRAING